jgi:hypothetical protein
MAGGSAEVVIDATHEDRVTAASVQVGLADPCLDHRDIRHTGIRYRIEDGLTTFVAQLGGEDPAGRRDPRGHLEREPAAPRTDLGDRVSRRQPEERAQPVRLGPGVAP